MTAAAAAASASAAAAAIPRANFTPPPLLGRGHRPSALRKSVPATATAGPSKRPLGCSKCRFNHSLGCAACGGSGASKRPTTPPRIKPKRGREEPQKLQSDPFAPRCVPSRARRSPCCAPSILANCV
jgi:hypothetical protein